MSEPPRPPDDDWEDAPTEFLPTERARPLPPREPEPVSPRPQARPERREARREPPPPPSFWRTPWPWLLLLLAGVLVGIAAVYLLTRDDGSPQKPVPNVVQLTQAQAERTLDQAGFDVSVDRGRSDDAPAGIVFAQSPAAGNELGEGETVAISVSSGPATTQVPSVVGLTADAAAQRLDAVGLQANSVEVFSQEPEGVVVAQSPAPGERVDVDSSVRINVSKGTENVAVPDVVGQDVDSASAALEDADLGVNAVRVPSQEPEGTVVAQNPAGGTQAARGSRVRINVSLGP
jgi:eukaryotic-like serine/threonine-protein kinase